MLIYKSNDLASYTPPIPKYRIVLKAVMMIMHVQVQPLNQIGHANAIEEGDED